MMETSRRQVSTSPPTDVGVSPDFRAVFDAEFGYVCRALRRLGVREADLKDVAQELFVSVHARLGDYDRVRPIRPWLFSFAVRYASNYRRLARNQTPDGETKGEPRTEDSPQIEARDLVLRALNRLDFDRRAVVVMHDLEGFAAPDIAVQLGVPLNTVYSRIRLARADFREAVEGLQHSKGGAT